MKKQLIKICSLIFILSISAQILFSQDNSPFSLNESPLPAPTSPVMDYSGVLNSATKQRIENQIIEFEKTSNPRIEIGVAIVDTTGNRPIFDYSLAVARGWGIGSREDDNPGVLLFIAVKDRKYYTQVSRNLEDELPDGLVGSLQRQYLVPQFKSGNYSKGVEDTIDAYIRTIKTKQSGEIPAEQTEDEGFGRTRDYSNDCSGLFFCLIFIGIIIFIVIANSGGGGGGGRGGKRRRKSSGGDVAGDILSGILTGIILGGGSGGSSSGGSSWGGGDSGGGWGGFGGGGDFGGGGAGGGW